MKGSVLRDKAELFAVRVIKMHRYLVDEKHEFRLSDQILRSGTSISANLAEGQFAQSGADFVSKLCIAQKEANETYMWLRNIFRGGYITEPQYNSMQSDVVELLKMLSSSIITNRKKLAQAKSSSQNN